MEFRLQRIALTFALLACEPGVDAQEASHLPAEAPPIGTMRKALLQDSKPYEVGIGAIPTTILMPAPIEAFEGNNISTTPGVPTIAFLQHTPGTRFFSVKAVIPGTADLNVIIGDAVFSFRFTFSMNPTRTLTIEVPGKARAEKPARTVHITARRLYEITQDAKTYFTVAQQYPEFDRAIEVTTPGKIIEYPGYRLVIDQVFRFDRDDTLVFRVAFLNDTASPRYYKPAEIGLRIGRNIYWPSFAQVSGSMAPRVPARIAWDVSPDVGSIIVKNPAGQVADLSDRSMAELGELGTYTIIATAKDGRSDSVKFTLKYPTPANEPNPLVVSKGEKEFGIRKLTVRQIEPSQSFGYVLYTGTADGRRADLSIHQDFALIVPTHETQP